MALDQIGLADGCDVDRMWELSIYVHVTDLNRDVSLALSEANPDILAVSQPITPPEILAKMFKPQALLYKVKINKGWLDSSRSLREQYVKENEVLLF
ncbi:Fermitin family-like protein 2 [Heterocephalus glaber]|uniref:Fermitin family-like protein 2 n=1 Tax=Heterocephalus glaber TaxID=10181 RepID=G5C1A4_HETGA|nr:Fermitin family-like protein 2 [Heterocephalus glaber]